MYGTRTCKSALSLLDAEAITYFFGTIYTLEHAMQFYVLSKSERPNGHCVNITHFKVSLPNH